MLGELMASTALTRNDIYGAKEGVASRTVVEHLAPWTTMNIVVRPEPRT
jgi:hypothetical protein